MISKNRIIALKVITASLGILFLITTFAFEQTSVWRWITFILWAVGLIAHLFTCRCPHCKRLALSYDLRNEEIAGRCKSCGNPVKWKEHQN